MLAACEGPTGPEGPAGPQGESGPGIRTVFSGTLDTSTMPDSTAAIFVLVSLPPQAGTVSDPPSASCWISPDSDL